MDEKIIVYPGDEIEIKKRDNKEILIGPGLRKDSESCIVSTKYGLLKQRENNFFWIDSHMKRVLFFFQRFFLLFIKKIKNLNKINFSTFRRKMIT